MRKTGAKSAELGNGADTDGFHETGWERCNETVGSKTSYITRLPPFFCTYSRFVSKNVGNVECLHLLTCIAAEGKGRQYQ